MILKHFGKKKKKRAAGPKCLKRADFLLLILVSQDPPNTAYATRSMFGKQMLLEKFPLITTLIVKLYVFNRVKQ